MLQFCWNITLITSLVSWACVTSYSFTSRNFYYLELQIVFFFHKILWCIYLIFLFTSLQIPHNATCAHLKHSYISRLYNVCTVYFTNAIYSNVTKHRTHTHKRVQGDSPTSHQHARSSRRSSSLDHVCRARESTRTWWAKVGYTDLSLPPSSAFRASSPSPTLPLQRFLPPTDEVPCPDSRPFTFFFQHLLVPIPLSASV